MPLVAGHKLEVDTASPQIYNAYDSMLTHEILAELKTLLPGDNAALELQGPKLIYGFERALQAPAIEMMLRGWRIDPWARDAGITELRRRLTRLSYIIDAYAGAIWDERSPTKRSNDRPAPALLNPNSEKQLQRFFYDCMGIPPIKKHVDGETKLPMDRDALEKLESYFLARPIILAILAYRDTEGQLEVLESEIDSDWRMRFSCNVAATTTGRLSMSKSITGSGRNPQNIEEDLRYMFISDPGQKLIGVDFEQAESRETGWLCGVLFGAWNYLNVVESGDCHTATARLIWPDKDWNGDKKHDRQIADQIFYRAHSYREVAKRVRHATEKGGKPNEIAKQTRAPLQLVKAAQDKLFQIFPELDRLFTWIAGQLQREHYLINAFGARRDFFGRADSNDTIKEGIAFMSQSPTANRTNLGWWRIWRYMPEQVELLLQLHDALYMQRDENRTDEATIIDEVRKHLDIPLSFRGRTFTVPTEAKTGWLWSNAYEPQVDGALLLKHPDGLMKFAGIDTRTRQGGNRCGQ